MYRYAIFVDAGYLLSAGGWATVGTWKRGELAIAYASLVEALQRRASAQCPGLELLRVYWYDAGPSRQPNADQIAISGLPDTKLRMGHLTTRGEQKGVDGLILADLIELSRGHAIVTAVLVAGDGDLVEAVTQAQACGVRVILWGVAETPEPTVSPDLRREADRFDPLRPSELVPYFSVRRIEVETVRETVAHPVTSPTKPADAAVPPPVYASLSPDDASSTGRDFARRLRLRLNDSDRARIRAEQPMIPADIDAQLIFFALEDHNLSRETRLSQEALYALRAGFWEVITEAE